MKTILKTMIIAALTASGIAGGAIADGHADKALMAAIKARQSQMQVIAYHTGLLGAVAKGEAEYTSEGATAAAENLAAAAGLHRELLWLEGSVQGTVEGTRATAKIWSDSEGFEKAAMGLEKAAADMITAAGQDQAAVGAAMAGLGGACKTCHEAYRGPKN